MRGGNCIAERFHRPLTWFKLRAMTRISSAPFLWFCLTAFTCRVLGQLLVYLTQPTWLPAMDHWQSGLLPYPVLLLSQITIIGLMTSVNYSRTTGKGKFSSASHRTKTLLWRVSIVYAAGMAVRLSWNALLGEGWTHDLIPVVFHFVLAFYLFALSLPAAGSTSERL